MRINRLEMQAFGPFTDAILDFGQPESCDLHVIFGPNEAGKSSALRALKAWLFGFPERTRDDFIHPRKQLLVGGELTEGERHLTFFRRKKRKGDLVDGAGNGLDSVLLNPFLGGLDLVLFESLYGIDHETLVRGGRDILARKGKIGETLFSAGAGLGSLNRVLEEMEAERDQLFRSRASKPRINRAIARHRTLSKEIRALSLSPEQWQEHAERLDQVSRALQEKTEQRKELDRRRRFLERLHRAVPLLARRARIIEQQQGLGPFRVLPSDFSRTRSRVQAELRSGAQRLEQATDRKEQILKSLKKLSPQKALIKRSARIEEGLQRLGEYRKAVKDRPRLEGMRSVHRRDGVRLLQVIAPDLSLEQAEQLLPLMRRKKKILSLVSRHETLMQAHRDADSRLGRAGQQLVQAEKKLAGMEKPRDSRELQQAIARARRAGDIDSTIRTLGRELADREETFRISLRQLGFWQGTAAELLELELPLGRTISLFRDEQRELERKREELEARVRDTEGELLTVRAGQQELIYGGDIPSEQELLEIRTRRDQGWQLVCRSWLDREDITEQAARYAPDTELSEAVYSLMLQADTISDRLRLEADRVHAFAGLRSTEEELTTRLQQIDEQEQQLAAALKDHEAAWQMLWKPLSIQPETPVIMADWRGEMVQLQQLAMDLEKKRRTLADLEHERQDQQQQIKEVVRAAAPLPDESELEPVLLAAESLLDELQLQEESLNRVSRDLRRQRQLVETAEHELSGIEDELEQWQRQWQKAARIPGVEAPFEPDAAQDLLDTVAEIFSSLDKADELESRLQGIERDCRGFEADTEKLAQEVAEDLVGQPVDRCVRQLHERLTAAGKEQALFEQYEKESEQLAREIRESELALAAARRELDGLLTIAGCTAEEELVMVEQNAAEHGRLAEQLAEVEQDLLDIAGDTGLEALAAQVEAVESDSLPGELHALEEQISQELDPAIRSLAEQKGEAGKVLEQMDGSEEAARKAEELESTLADLRLQADHYLRLQVGIDLLRREIEAFRRQNQDPVLTITSSIFAELTLGSFSGLKTDVDDRGEPVLVGVRSETGQPVEVEAMSTGSRDQLYLALRLAALQHRSLNGQTMPLIVDDILINFDDERSAATLKVLADLGRSNQLILFSHHQQVAGQARLLDGVRVHELAGTT